MSYPRTLSPLVLALSLFACEPVDPIIDGGPAPADGLWEMEVIAVDSHGRCGLTDDTDLLGLTMEMELKTRDEHGIRFDLEGLMLKGYIDSGWIHAEGGLTTGPTVSVAIDDGVDVEEGTSADDDDVDHGGASSEGSEGRSSEQGGDSRRPPSDSEGIHATIEGWTMGRGSMEGELTIQYDLPETQCVLVLEFEAEYMGRRDRDEPVPVEPREDPEKPDDEPYETDED